MFSRTVASAEPASRMPAARPQPAAPQALAVVPAQRPPSPPPVAPQLLQPASSPSISVIGNDLTILGQGLTIISRGSLQLDGEIDGNLHGTEIVIGEKGRVTGSITADTVTVHGQVSGVIRGAKVSLVAPCRVEGEIVQETLVIDPGAYFEGKVRRPKDAAEVKPVLDPSQLGEAAGGGLAIRVGEPSAA